MIANSTRIDFVDNSVPGWDLSSQNKMPHSYKAGSQTQLLNAQIENMRQGGTYCMVAPPNPYRCPQDLMKEFQWWLINLRR